MPLQRHAVHMPLQRHTLRRNKTAYKPTACKRHTANGMHTACNSYAVTTAYRTACRTACGLYAVYMPLACISLESKRKRKYSDTCDVGWNDGIDDKGQYRAEMRRRSKGYVTNRASTRDFNSKFKATGCDRPVAVAPAGAGASAPAPIVAALPYAEL